MGIFSRVLWALLLGVDASIASPVRARSAHSSGYALKESHPIPRKWAQVGPAPGDHILKLQIGLKQENFDELERHLYEVSDPANKRYGNHLSEDEVNELVKPSEDATNLVHDWLFENGIGASQLEYSPARDWIKVSLPVETVETLLDTEYSVYEYVDAKGDFLVRTPRWSLPVHLHEHIATIQPTNSFFQPRPHKSTLKTVARLQQDESELKVPQKWKSTSAPTVDQVCNVSAITPDCLRTLYGTFDYTPQVAGKNKVALTNYLHESNNRSDVGIFLKMFRAEAASAANDFQVVVIANGDDDQTAQNATALGDGRQLEGNLDAETILGIAWPTPLIAYTTGGSPPYNPDLLTPTDTNEPYLTWLQFVLAQSNDEIPSAISTSYGDDEQTVPFSYAQSVCNGFAQLGARGKTVLFSSGDDGVGMAADCMMNDGKNTSTFLPSFPAGCPYVTTVGATMNINPEVVANDPENGFTSGGGFSNYFAMPDYQRPVVEKYVESLGDQFAGLYNMSGRGYPDLAAQGFHYIVLWDAGMIQLDGTSASCPTVTSVIALVNDALIAANKSTLGFLNPWLYRDGSETFTDVTSGSSLGCNTKGFPAREGWDAVTGFGTPNFPEFKNRALECL